MTSSKSTCRALVIRHTENAPAATLHLIHETPGYTDVLSGIADGVPGWRMLAKGDKPGPRDGLTLDAVWFDALRAAFADGSIPIGPPPPPATDEIKRLRDDLEGWRLEMSSRLDVDRERIDRLIDGITSGS